MYVVGYVVQLTKQTLFQILNLIIAREKNLWRSGASIPVPLTC